MRPGRTSLPDVHHLFSRGRNDAGRHRSDLAVLRGRYLHSDKRASFFHQREEAFIECFRLRFTYLRFHLDASGLELCDALPIDLRIGISAGDDTAADARRDDRIDARRGLALVRAWLERNV